MAKDLSISILLDYYGNALTQKQREMIELYYNQDLSLAEITEHVGITRQGVRDSIKRGEAVLLDLEGKLGLAQTLIHMERGLEALKKEVDHVDYCNGKAVFSRDIAECVGKMKLILEEIDPDEESENVLESAADYPFPT